jgi:ADP-ribosylation factor related protein 1
MFSLIFGFYNMIFSKPDVHILIVGLDYAGKSTLLEHIKSKYGPKGGVRLKPDQITPTIGMNLAKFKHKGTQVVLWDLGGQLKMRAVWERYYSEANAVVFVVDASDPERLQESYAAYLEVCASPLLRNVPIVILANKQDISGAISLQEIAGTFFAQSNQFATSGTGPSQPRLFGVSGLTGQGVSEALQTLVSEAQWHVQKSTEEMADF